MCRTSTAEPSSVNASPAWRARLKPLELAGPPKRSEPADSGLCRKLRSDKVLYQEHLHDREHKQRGRVIVSSVARFSTKVIFDTVPALVKQHGADTTLKLDPGPVGRTLRGPVDAWTIQYVKETAKKHFFCEVKAGYITAQDCFEEYEPVALQWKPGSREHFLHLSSTRSHSSRPSAQRSPSTAAWRIRLGTMTSVFDKVPVLCAADQWLIRQLREATRAAHSVSG